MISQHVIEKCLSCFWQYSELKQRYLKAPFITKKAFVEELGDMVALYNSLGNICQALGQFNEAKTSRVITKKIFSGEVHSDVAASYNNLGIFYQALRQYNEAKEYHD